MRLVEDLTTKMKALKERQCLILMFLIGVIIRSIPHIMTPHPLGFDTIDYAAEILDWKKYFSTPSVILESPLLTLLLAPFHIISKINPFVILRFTQPLLYGLLSTSFYFAAIKLFRWKSEKAWIAILIFSLHTATLRISWDLLRNELSLALLLFTLPFLKDFEKRQIKFAVFSILVILSHQMTAALLLFIVFTLSLNHFRKKEYSQLRKLIYPSIPSIVLFLLVCLHASCLLQSPVPEVTNPFPEVLSIPLTLSLPLPLVNYMAGEALVNYNNSYTYLLNDVISLYMASYLLLLPLVVLGLRNFREKITDSWMILCTICSFSCLISPHAAIGLWDRWIQMLVVPYSFYAVNGLIKVKDNWPKVPIKKLTAIFITTLMLIAVLYSTTSYTNPVSPYAAFWSSSKYSPPTMLSNTAPVEHTPKIIESLQWLNQNMKDDSCILVRKVFLGWSKIYLNKNATLINYYNEDVEVGLSYAQTLNYTDIYWIWWENSVGLHWYGQKIPNNFEPIYVSGEIVVYKHV